VPTAGSPVEVWLCVVTSLYDGGPTDPLDREPRAHDDPTIRVGDELRGIAYVDAISYLDLGGITQTAFNPGLDGFEVTGVYHSLEVASVDTVALGGVQLIHVEYVPMDDQHFGAGGVLEDEDGVAIDGAGGRVTLYSDISALFDFTWDPDRASRPLGPDDLPVPGTPDEWVQGPDYANEHRLDFGTAGAFDANGNNELVDGGDVQVVFDGVFVPLQPLGLSQNPETVLVADLIYYPGIPGFPQTGGVVGVAQGFVNAIRDGQGGPANDADIYTHDSESGTVVANGIADYMFGEAAAEGAGADFHVFMNIGSGSFRRPRLTELGETGWAFSNNDPITFVNAPEPATTFLFGIPLAMLARRLRRRKRRS